MERSNPNYMPDPNQVLGSQITTLGYQGTGSSLPHSQYPQSLPPLPPVSHPQTSYHLSPPSHSYHHRHHVPIMPLYNPNIYRIQQETTSINDSSRPDEQNDAVHQNIDDAQDETEEQGQDLTKSSNSKLSHENTTVSNDSNNQISDSQQNKTESQNISPINNQPVKQNSEITSTNEPDKTDSIHDPKKNLYLDPATGQYQEMIDEQSDAVEDPVENNVENPWPDSDREESNIEEEDKQTEKEPLKQIKTESCLKKKPKRSNELVSVKENLSTDIIKNVEAEEENEPKTRGYDQILELCEASFPSNIQLIQDIINMSHNLSKESSENIENVCNKLMSELLHLNHSISELCKSSLDTEQLKSDNSFSGPFEKLLNAWKLNMIKKKKDGKLTQEDQEMLKMESLNSSSDWNNSVPASGMDFDFTPSSAFGKVSKSPKKSKSRAKTAAKSDDENDQDYLPSAEKRVASRRSSLKLDETPDSKRSLRNRSKNKVYEENVEMVDDEDDPDYFAELPEAEKEAKESEIVHLKVPKFSKNTQPVDQSEHKCPVCDLPFKSVRSVALHKRQKHASENGITNIRKGCLSSNKSISTPEEKQAHASNKEPEKIDLTKTSILMFECKTCGATFRGKLKYDLHLRSHNYRKSQKCSVCNKMFPTQSLLVKHRQIAHKDTMTFKCSECDRCFKTETPLKYHLMKHKGQLPFPCRYCENQYPNISSRNNHELTHSDERRFSCDMCDKKFKTQHSLKKHNLLHSGEKAFQCDFCGQQFRQKSTLTSHRRTHTGEKPYICDVCGKAFTQSSILNMHKRVHTGYKPHQCTYCESAFSCGASLRKHLTIHTGEKNFMCKVCGRRFARAQGLKHHERSHTGVKPYECKECGKRFTCPKHVKRHKLMHTGEFPFTCNVCGKLFRQEYNMKVHMRVHTGDKPFQCMNCGRCFAYNQSLQMHSSHCVKQVGFLGYDIQLHPVSEIR